MGTVSLSRGQSDWGVALISPHPAPALKKRKAIPLLPLCAFPGSLQSELYLDFTLTFTFTLNVTDLSHSYKLILK
jgi:hypothetical protein